jgi:hypothetical protein
MNDSNRSNRPQQPPTRVDPITGAVIQGALENIAIVMGHKLAHELFEPRVGRFRRCAHRCRRTAIMRVQDEYAAAIRADPRLGICKPLPGAARCFDPAT